MDQIIKYSGILMLIFSWAFVVFPYLFLRKKHKLFVFSDIGALPKYGVILNTGVFLVAVSQLIFWLYLKKMFAISNFNLGILFLIVSSVILFFVGLVHRGMNVKVHDRLAQVYFTLSTLGSLLLSVWFYNISKSLSLVEILLTIVLGAGMIAFYSSGKWLLAEIWVIFFSSLWVLLIYIYLI